MEQVIITPEQKLLLDKFRKNQFLSSNFYFTGGTALSLYYLKHRLSVDLDFFSEHQFDPQIILDIMTSWGKDLNFTIDYLATEKTQIFNLMFSNKQTTKVDFSLYPYKQVKACQLIDGIRTDSLMDIAINKLLTIEQRTEVKDFVDLYFLLEQFTVWDLLEGVRVKFKIEIEPLIIGSDFLKIEDFTFLPRMIKPLTLNELRLFYREKAKELGAKSFK